MQSEGMMKIIIITMPMDSLQIRN